MKGENKLKTMIILGIIITVVIAGTVSCIATLSAEYSLTPNLGTINKSVELGDEINQAYELFEDEENVQSSWLGDTIVTGGKIIWSFITLTIKTPGLIVSLVQDLGKVLGVPPIFLAGIGVIILTIGLFAVLDILSG